MLAWPTLRGGSTGFGANCKHVVGSAMSQTDDLMNDELGLTVPSELETFRQEHMVKSAVGSKRITHKIMEDSRNKQLMSHHFQSIQSPPMTAQYAHRRSENQRPCKTQGG